MPDLIDEVLAAPQHAAAPTVIDSRQSGIRHFATPAYPRFGYTLQLLRIGVPIWLADLAALLTALLISFVAVTSMGMVTNHFVPFAGGFLVAYSLCYWAAGSYPGVGVDPAREIRQLFRGSTAAATASFVAVAALSNWASPYLTMLVISYPLTLLLPPVYRGTTKECMHRCRLGVPFYFLGKRHEVMRVYRDMTRFGWTMLRPAGSFTEPDGMEALDKEDFSVRTTHGTDTDFELKFEREVGYLGTPDDLLTTARNQRVFWLLVVGVPPSETCHPGVLAQYKLFPEVIWIKPTTSVACAGASILNCGLTTGIRVEEPLLLFWPRLQKRIMDICLAAACLVVLSPFMLAIAVLIKLASPGPILFASSRLGEGGRLFKAWKFRSMVTDGDEMLERHFVEYPELKKEWEQNHKLRQDPRVTWIGKILRKTSFDEVPQLWNVLIGEMSLVGPRPILPDEIEKFEGALAEYVRVRPGITGLWQVSGRNQTEYSERLVYANYYVRRWSIWLDIHILFRTIKTVFLCEGAY